MVSVLPTTSTPTTTITALPPWRQGLYKYAYLFSAFPLGLLYFVFIVAGLSVGVGTLVIWIGVAVLVFMLFATVRLAAIERWLAVHLLPPVALPSTPASVALTGSPLSRRRIMERLRDPLSWTSLAFLLLKFPCGLFYFVATVTLLIVSLVAVIISLVLGLISAPFVALGLLLLGAPSPNQSLRRYLTLAATGFGVGVVALFLIDQMAQFARFLAVALLVPSAKSLRLQAMAAQVAHERERAAQADQRRRQLIVDLSHELRTPIASITAHLESLQLLTDEGTTPAAPETVFQYSRIADHEAHRLAALVDELLSLARMESDELRLDIQPVAAGDVIEAVYQALAPLAARERHIMLVRGADPHLPPVLADRQRLTQVLTNLVRNAIAYTPAGGLVSMNLESADDGCLAIIVADNGIGIPEEDRERIFERYTRLEQSGAHASGGFGLGLPIVQHLVSAMGGTLTVDSAEGAGSRFTVLLRCAV